MSDANPNLRNAVIVGANSAIGTALIGALMALPQTGHVFALCRGGLALQDPGAPPAAHERPTAAGTPDQRTLLRLAADPTAPASLAAAADAVAGQVDRVHRLIICTGTLHGGDRDPTFRPEKSLGQLRLAQLQHSIAVNAWAPLAAINAFAPLLRHADGAVAAALSAMVGSIGDNRLGGWYSYRMSKAALNMGIRNAAIELGRHRHGPIVVAIHPGTTQSPLSKPFAGQDRARPATMSAAAILRVIDGLERNDSGRLLNWDGSVLPW